MQIEGKGGGVFRSSDRTGRGKDRERKGQRCSGMADAKVRQRCTKIPGTGKLLLLVYRRIRNSGKAVT